jgi:hypothetical protein
VQQTVAGVVGRVDLDVGGLVGMDKADVESRGELEEIGNVLLEPVFPVTKGVRLLGVSLSSLVAEEAERERQVSLSL